MLKSLPSFRFTYIISYLLLLQMINISVNPARHLNIIDGKPTYMEDLRVNKIESIYEFISEFLFKKSVPESQDQDDEATLKVQWSYLHTEAESSKPIAWQEIPPCNFYYLENIPECYLGNVSPPPKS